MQSEKEKNYDNNNGSTWQDKKSHMNKNIEDITGASMLHTAPNRAVPGIAHTSYK